MTGTLLNKVELDVMQANELADSIELAVGHFIPAIVVHPQLIGQAIVLKGLRQGRFKIITPVDWPKGDITGIEKLKGLNADAIRSDGFEFLLNGSKTMLEIRNEAKILTNFVRTHISEIAEIRFVLGFLQRGPEAAKTVCEALKDVRTPQYVRTDHHIKTQVSKANPDIHNEHIKIINENVNVPIKISGNINGVRSITNCAGATRFAVNLTQAKNIIKELRQHPDQLKEILT